MNQYLLKSFKLLKRYKHFFSMIKSKAVYLSPKKVFIFFLLMRLNLFLSPNINFDKLFTKIKNKTLVQFKTFLEMCIKSKCNIQNHHQILILPSISSSHFSSMTWQRWSIKNGNYLVTFDSISFFCFFRHAIKSAFFQYIIFQRLSVENKIQALFY